MAKVMKNKVERIAIPLTRVEWYSILGALNNFISEWELELTQMKEEFMSNSITSAIAIAVQAREDIFFFISLEER